MKAFLPQRKVEGLCFFGNQYFQSIVFLFSGPNKGNTFFFRKYTFQKWAFTQFWNLYNGAENNLEALATSLRTFTPMLASLIIFRTGTYFFLLVQLLLQDRFDAIAHKKILNYKDNFNDKNLVVSARSKWSFSVI